MEGTFSLLTYDVDFQGALVDFFSAVAVWWGGSEAVLYAVNETSPSTLKEKRDKVFAKTWRINLNLKVIIAMGYSSKRLL